MPYSVNTQFSKCLELDRDELIALVHYVFSEFYLPI